MKSAASPSVVVITGLSGSGKTVALRSLEDAEFFCVDNLPVSLIAALIRRFEKAGEQRSIAVGIDIREREFLTGFSNVVKGLRNNCRLEILFLEADTDVLIRRFKETRRPHPLGGNLEDAIRKERETLAPLRDHADRVIDTSSLSPHQLRRLIASLYLPSSAQKDITVSLTSFGFKYGVPQNIDLLFDVRFLPNPFFVPELKRLSGRDKPVVDYIFRNKVTRDFMKMLEGMLSFLIPLYIKEGKSYLSIAVGCTGGNHRSPAIVEKIARSVRNKNLDLHVIHRDLS